MISILFSVENLEKMLDVVKHLNKYDKLYFNVGYAINKKQFEFPLTGYVNIKGTNNVKYCVRIEDIEPFTDEHFKNKAFKPHKWIKNWANKENKRNWKYAYVITDIKEFEFIITELKKIDGKNVLKAPQGYTKILSPQETVLFQDEPFEINNPEKYYEGASKKVSVNSYERDQKARKRCIDHYGHNCQVCGFNFKKKYGKIGNGFIHVHHIKPLSEINKEYEVDPIKDLRPVCPNCHAMLHRDKNSLSIQKLKALVN